MYMCDSMKEFFQDSGRQGVLLPPKRKNASKELSLSQLICMLGSIRKIHEFTIYNRLEENIFDTVNVVVNIT